jgi:hypothetical protein
MMKGAAARAATIFQLALLVVSCAPVGNSVPEVSTTAAGTSMTSSTGLTAEQKAAGWRSLFDGTGTGAWRGYQSQAMPSGWRIVDGILTKKDSVPDIISKDQFGNFELALDWMESPGGNAGIFYRGTEEYDHVYWSAPEYQLLDDAADSAAKADRAFAAGAAYALYPSPAGIIKGANEWNSAMIAVQGNRVQHWANGQKLLEYELASPEWEARVKASKFKDYPNYGRAKRGHIAIQGDHHGTLSIRNVRIRELP